MMLNKLLAASVGVASLAAGFAHAADLPYRAIPPAPPPVFSWTGGYLGSVVGVDFLDGRADPRCVNFAGVAGGLGCPIIGNQRLSSVSYLLGATSGYNLQMGQFVLGIESDIQSTGLNSTKTLTGPFPAAGGGVVAGNGFLREQINAFGTARGRLGLAWGRSLFYVTGGVIYANVNLVTNQVSPAGPAFIGHSNSSHLGGVAGAGVEYAFTDRWSAKIEGLYYNLGNKTILPSDITGAAPPPIALGAKFKMDGELVRVGLNYRFGSLW